ADQATPGRRTGHRPRRGQRGRGGTELGLANPHVRAAGSAGDQRPVVVARLAAQRPAWRAGGTEAAPADIGVAVASFYPDITLSGSFSIQALQPKYLATWAANQYSFGPSITLPIFEGGKLKATLELRKAQQQEAAVTYERTLLNAWHEVDNDLTAYDAEQRRREQLAQAVESNRRALALARDRYTQGLIDFLQVLVDERSLFASQEDLASSTTAV